MNNVNPAHTLMSKPSSKALMGQVLGKSNLDLPNVGLKYILANCINESQLTFCPLHIYIYYLKASIQSYFVMQPFLELEFVKLEFQEKIKFSKLEFQANNLHLN